MTTRHDIHRVSQIQPEDYDLVLCYALSSMQGGWPVPAVGINCEIEKRHEVEREDGTKVSVNGEHAADGRCCVVGMRQAGVRFAEHGGPGTCTVCGTHHTYGDIWAHRPTGEHIFVGHQCADKYELIADRREFERELGKVRVRSAREHEKAMREEERAAFLDAHDGLREALETDHEIVRDIKDRFENGRYTSLTERQIALVFKLHHEANRPARPEEKHVPAPIESGRQTVEGEIVSVKFRDSRYGGSFKLTVKVHTPEGSWLAWGTCPAVFIDAAPDGHVNKLRGAVVQFDAKLKQGRDAHFALFSRPTKAAVVELKEVDEAA